MKDKFDSATIALAGFVQSISLIKDIAQTGKTNETLFQTSINSIFQTDPENVEAVFGSLHDLRLGFETLIQTLSSTSGPSRIMTRYMLSLMGLQKKISYSPLALKTLTQRIEQVKKQVDYFSLTHPTVIANLADIYLCIIHPFRFRFFILGNQQILNVNENMEKIRALLLAAIRASVLWRQSGGSRLQLLFYRGKIKNSAVTLLKKIVSEQTEGKSL